MTFGDLFKARPYLRMGDRPSRSGNGKKRTRGVRGAGRPRRFVAPDPESIPVHHRHAGARMRAQARAIVAARTLARRQKNEKIFSHIKLP